MPLVGAGCKSCWREPVQARVWALGVVIDPPSLYEPSRRHQAAEEVLVEAFIPESTIYADELAAGLTASLTRRMTDFHRCCRNPA
jgi:hypothetical protein